MNNPRIGQIALITGASSGIGESTARLLASKGIHVLLVARRIDRLNEIRLQIISTGGHATAIQADLTIESERVALYQQLIRQNLLPEILINNAGMAWYGYYHQMPWDIAKKILELNITTVTHLTSLFLPEMVKNQYGHIINIGSIAGKLPEQGIAVYSASKAYMDAFTTSLYRELKGTGVVVSVVRAGPIKTEFFDAARNLENGDSVPAEKLAVPVSHVSNAIWRLLLHPRRMIYVPFYLRFSPLLEILFSGIIDQVGPLLLKIRGRIR